MMSVRSEGQFNTVVYEEEDAFRNIKIGVGAGKINEKGIRGPQDCFGVPPTN